LSRRRWARLRRHRPRPATQLLTARGGAARRGAASASRPAPVLGDRAWANSGTCVL